MRTKPTAAVTRPEKKARLSGDSVRVSTRDQTIFTEKQATQIMHAAMDISIGRAALADTIDFVRRFTRPWIDSGQDRATEDPYTIAQIGDLTLRQSAADALLESRSGVQAAQGIVTALDDADRLTREDVAEPRVALDEILAEVLAKQGEHTDRAA